jgi:hypothetical protein
MALTAHEKKIVILIRLRDGDRIVRQRPSECGTFPDAAWTLKGPQAKVWLSTLKWLERHGMIAESIQPASREERDGSKMTDERMRIYYQRELRHRIYAITEKGRKWLDTVPWYQPVT